jgi:hypothetical protein
MLPRKFSGRMMTEVRIEIYVRIADESPMSGRQPTSSIEE